MAATISRQAQNSNTFAYLPFQEPSCPVRQLYVPANSIHDFHPSIAPSGLYWVVSVPERDLTISPDENTFTLEMQNVTVVDQPRWPAQDSIATPARMSFKMVWKLTGEHVKYEDSSKHFRFIGTRASCQLGAEVEVPSIGFSWKPDPLNASKCD